MNYLKKNEEILEVTELYPYRYDYGKGKTVLRLKVPYNIDFTKIQMFFCEISDYEYYENEELKTIYLQYGADLDIHYKGPSTFIEADGTVTESEPFYEIEILRSSMIESDIKILYTQNTNLKKENERVKEQVETVKSGFEKENQILQDQLESGKEQLAEDLLDTDYRLSIIELGLL